MVSIIFESHGTTLDNEKGLSSGRFDVELSNLGKRQAAELGERYRSNVPDVVYCSDLRRSYETANIAFPKGVKIRKDARLTECDYGDFTRKPEDEVKQQRGSHVIVPFPYGESYVKCADRMKKFLRYVAKRYDGKKVLVIGHRATQYGLEHWIKGVPLKDAVTAPWQWSARLPDAVMAGGQPGWVYKLTPSFCPNVLEASG